MTRAEYIRRTLAALCGTRPATPQEYYSVSAMADRAASAFKFDKE